MAVLIAQAVLFRATYFCMVRYTRLHQTISSFDIMYHRAIFGLCLLFLYSLVFKKKTVFSSMFELTPKQAPTVLVRCLSNSIAHLMLMSAMYFTSASKAFLIFESPFISSIMAYLILRESITKTEIGIFSLATIGVILMSTEKDPHVMERELSAEIVGCFIALAAGVINNVGIVAVRSLKDTPVQPFLMIWLNEILVSFTEPFYKLASAPFRKPSTPPPIYKQTLLCFIFFVSISFTISGV